MLSHFLIFFEMSCQQHPTSYRHDCKFFSNSYLWWSATDVPSMWILKLRKKWTKKLTVNWLWNRILCGSLKSLLWIGYNQNLKRSGWENSFLVGHLSNMTPVRFSAEKKINNGNTKSTISTNSTAHSPHTHIGRYIMHCLPCVFGHFQFISFQSVCLLN